MAGYYKGSGSFRKQRAREDVDPMSSMGNVGDIMLVFACGLMVALVLAWNVDLAQFAQVELDEELNQDDVTQMNEQLYGEGNAFKEMGTVYQDPATGKFYLVEEGTSASDAAQAVADGEGGQGSADNAGNADGGTGGE